MITPVLPRLLRCLGLVLALLGMARSGEAALIAYWPLDNSTANAVTHGPVGVLGGDAAFSSAQTAPGSTHSLQFDGSGDHLRISGASDLAALAGVFQGDFTVSLWGRSNLGASALGVDIRYLFDIGSAHGGGFGMVFNRNHSMWTANNIGFYYNGYALSSGVQGLADTWYHLAVTRQGNAMSLYVDGALKGTTSIAPVTINYATDQEAVRGPLVFGDQAKIGERDWNGYLDEIALWNQTLSGEQIQALANGSRQPLDIPVRWQFQADMFAGSAERPTAVGPWLGEGRWRYKSNTAITNHNYASAGIDEFPDLGYFSDGSPDKDWWIDSETQYPGVRISNKTLHPGNTATIDRDVVVAWEAGFEGFIDVDYQSTGGNTLGYQVLQWDASAGQMRVLQQRLTHGPTGYGPRQIRTRVEPGDQILYVLDADGTAGADRTTFQQTIVQSQGPQLGDAWDFASEVFTSTSLANGAGPWKNSARWRYMSSSHPRDYAYDSPEDFSDFTLFSDNIWQNPDAYPQVRLSDKTLHAGEGNGQAVLAWESDFEGLIRYAFSPEPFYAGTTVNYQVLWWDADGGADGSGLMTVLCARNELAVGEAPVVDRLFVGIGDLIYFVLDNRDGNRDQDRIFLGATITMVPEPATALLGLVGVLGLAMLRRRRRGLNLNIPEELR